MQLGSVYGHGAYQAPDWTADWLHRELVAWLNIKAQADHGKAFDKLTSIEKMGLQQQLKEEYRGSSMGSDNTVMLSDTRIATINQVAPYYIDLYGDTPELASSRESFAMKITHCLI